MKKLNEDVTIVDPVLAQQYANAQKQILDKDKQINNLQRQVNNLEAQKVQLHQAMVTIEQKAAQSQEQPVKRAETTTPAQGEQTQQQTAESLDLNKEFEDILIEEYGDDEEPRFSFRPVENPKNPNLIYMDGKLVGTEETKLIKKRGAKINLEKETELEKRIEEIENEINDLRDEIERKMEDFKTPSYEGIELEIEDFWGQIGSEAQEILNSGVYTDELEILKELEKVGVENPKEVLGNYYAYFPEYDRRLDMDRVKVEEEVENIKKEIELKEIELKEHESEYENEIASRYEEKKKLIQPNKPLPEQFEDDSWPSKDIWYDEKDELSDEDIYQEIEDVPQPAIEDIENIDQEYVEPKEFEENPASYSNFWGLDEDVDEKKTREDYLDDSFLFYARIIENDKPFVGKIFKISPDSDWTGVVKVGESPTFEKITYEPEYDELDIIEFLKDNYEDVEILDRHEYNEYFLNTEHDEVIENMVEGSALNLETLKNKIENFDKLVRESANDNTNFLFIFGEKGNDIHEQYLKHDTFESFWESLDMDQQYELYNWLEHTSFMNEYEKYMKA